MTCSTCAVPLSYQQEMYWAAERRRTIGYRLVADNRHVANTYGGIRVRGAFHVDVLQRSLNEVLRRHASLRTRLQTTADGRTVQIVTDADTVPVECIDVSRSRRSRSQASAERAAAMEAARAALGAFDYAAGLLVRAHVIKVSDDDSIVVFVVPHIVSDSVSVQVLIDEVLTLYAHFLHGRPTPLPEPEWQYADFVGWQRDWVRREIAPRADEYVTRHLVGARPMRVPLDTNTCDEAATDADAAEIRFVLDERGIAAVHALSKWQRVTPFVVMLSAFDALLARWSGHTDVLLLAPFAARPTPPTQKVIGLFSNLCPLRADVSGDPPFADLLEQVQRSLLEAMDYRCVPHAVVSEMLRERGDISCTGVGINAVPEGGRVMPRGCKALFDPDTEVLPYVVDTSSLAVRQMRGHLSLWVGFSAAGGISGRLMYRRASFAEQTIARLANAFTAALERAADQPDRRLSYAFAEV